MLHVFAATRSQPTAAIAEAEAYDAIRNRAIEYRIPILNQNRFLYLVGYYNQSAR